MRKEKFVNDSNAFAYLTWRSLMLKVYKANTIAFSYFVLSPFFALILPIFLYYPTIKLPIKPNYFRSTNFTILASSTPKPNSQSSYQKTSYLLSCLLLFFYLNSNGKKERNPVKINQINCTYSQIQVHL